MKKFKKLVLLLFAFLMVVTLSACGNKNVEGSLDEIVDKLVVDVDDEMKTRLESRKLTSENINQYVGTDDIKFTEGIVQEHITGSVAYSVVLLRVEDSDIESVKTKIKENINPRKWICVGVEPEDVIIKNKGNLVIAIVVENEEYRTSISKAFDNL